MVREKLILPDGYASVVFRHGSAGGGRTPVVYLHGIQSHPGWFVASAEALAAAGHEVFQVTRRGSGENQAGRGHARSVRQLLDDLSAAVEHARRATGQQHVALVGVSWGGKLAAAWAMDRPEAVASLTLVAPGLYTRVRPPIGTMLAVPPAAVLCPRATFDIPLNDPALFTDNPVRRQFIADDPLRLLRATARFFLSSHALDWRLARAARRGGCIACPTTLILARRDRIIDNARTRRLVERLTAAQARVVELDAAHTLEFEPDPGPFLAALVAAPSP